MIDDVEIVIVELLDPIDEVALHMFSGEGVDGIGERSQVRGDDAIAAARRQSLHQRLPDLAARAGHQHRFLGHEILLSGS
ncbi:MAG: hypothetical protein PGMFKBFP_01201 [Anaerolineales bacterium]|nr:hypothetical protein [Anaerolineales bacterium]